MSWSFNQTEPVFLQIAQGLRTRILSGELAPGSAAPTVRQLAADTAVNPNTVQHALTVLEEEGLLHTQGTTGRFVTTDEGVLSASREALLQRTAARFVREAHSMGLCAKDLIRYIEKEEERYE
ncbi:MAG: GntR family transcriptional regulator [Clostridia bacterium]|nr:GntR family transcriptional regulator [Clostridia bacterium]